MGKVTGERSSIVTGASVVSGEWWGKLLESGTEADADMLFAVVSSRMSGGIR